MVYKNIFFAICVIFFAAFLFSACTESSSADDSFNAADVCPESARGTFIDDRDGQVYKYTTIGGQVWMAENLSFDDGSPCAIETEEVCTKGRIYGIEPALKACPTGWHLPTKEEWTKLFESVGGEDSAGIRLKATTGWTPLNPGELSNGTDDCGFSLLPIPVQSMHSNGLGAAKKRDGFVALLWANSRALNEDYKMLGFHIESENLGARGLPYYTGEYLSIRCVKD